MFCDFDVLLEISKKIEWLIDWNLWKGHAI